MRHVCGIDEAGRGPLAGPVYAAAVILDASRPIDGLRDSKKLSAPRRLQLAVLIRERALAWAVARADVTEIEELNILGATLLAMRRACHALATRPVLARVDGNRAPALDCEVQTIVGGDDSDPCIAAASILAKVERDACMMLLDAQHPGYGFARHKGYGTLEHRTALARLGPCSEHRKGFLPVRQASLFHSDVKDAARARQTARDGEVVSDGQRLSGGRGVSDGQVVTDGMVVIEARVATSRRI